MARTLRAWRAVLAIAGARGLRRLRLGRAGAAGEASGAWCRRRRSAPNSSSGSSRGGVESVRIPIGWGAVQPQRRRRRSTGAASTRRSKRPPAPGIDVLPFLTGAPTWAVPADRRSGGGGAKAPAHLPVSGAAARRLGRLPQRGGRPLRARTAASGPSNPSVPKRPIRTWQIWNEPNFKYFVARPNPAEYGKLVKISYDRARRRPTRARKVVLAGLFARPKGAQLARPANHHSAYFASRLPRTDVQDDPGDQVASSTASPCTPTPSTYQRPDARDRRSPRRAEGQPRRRQGPLDHRARLELRAADPPGNSFAKGPAGQAQQLKGAFRCCVNKQREMADPARLLVLGRRPRRRLQLLRRLRPLRPGLHAEEVLVRLRQVRRRHPCSAA